MKMKHANCKRNSESIFLFGFVIGWNHLFSTPAVADDAKLTFLQQSIQSVQNVGSFQMEVYARTTQQENFATFDPAMPFVKIDIKLLRQNDFLFYRVEKANGRTVVSDGRNQYMWIPNVLYLKGSQESDFLEHFANLIFPERLLTIQKSAIKLSNENKMAFGFRAADDSLGAIINILIYTPCFSLISLGIYNIETIRTNLRKMILMCSGIFIIRKFIKICIKTK
jgi:hypothetical protein